MTNTKPLPMFKPTTSVKTRLRRMLQIFSIPGSHCRYQIGRTITGGTCYGSYPKAVQVCLIGAEARASNEDYSVEATKLVAKALGKVSAMDAITWNNAPKRTQSDVVKAIEKALKLAGGR